MTDEKSKLVYSTDKLVSRKEKPGEDNVKPVLNSAQQKLPAGRNVIVRLDRKGRGGKSVTLIEGLRITAKEREKLLRELKARLGTGGTLKDTSIEIQGDHCDAILTILKKRGYSPKHSGG